MCRLATKQPQTSGGKGFAEVPKGLPFKVYFVDDALGHQPLPLHEADMDAQQMSIGNVENALSNLANCMRLYVEAHVRFGSIFNVDREEAIHNLERAFEAKLEAFHILYDVSKDYFPYFDRADSSVIIALRNAMHHRDHPLFRGLMSELWLADDSDRRDGAQYLLARHRTSGGSTLPMTAYFKLDDFRARLDPDARSPHRDKFLKGEKVLQRYCLINAELGFDAIRQVARTGRYPDNQVYIDMMPVFVSAISRAFKALDNIGVSFKGFDAGVYKAPFTSELEVDLRDIEYIPFKLTNFTRPEFAPSSQNQRLH